MLAKSALEIHEDDTVSVLELPTLLHTIADVKILSLDCFDTLLWRKVQKPTDVFFELQHRPAFRRVGLDAGQRIRAERLARRLAFIQSGNWETTLAAIFKIAVPDADGNTIAALEEEELQAECDACFPLPEAVALLRSAKAEGVPVVIVSDTYLREAQLRHLLASCLPADAYEAITRVVVSCEHGTSKGQALFESLLRKGILPREETLHVGDNPKADLLAPLQSGIRARVLHRFPQARAERMHDRANAWRLVDPGADGDHGMPSPWHSTLARLEYDTSDPARELGLTSLGPMMHGFASWILAQRSKAIDSGRKLKIAFLMRDGYLPWRACNAIAGEEIGKCIYISRFSAFAAGFRTIEDIDRYLAMNAKVRNLDIILKQLGIRGALANEILRKVERAGGSREIFISQLRSPAIVERITRWSAGFRERMRRHLEAELDLRPGETLAFVDLGYFGNIQRALAPVMREEWGVELLGWYFLCYPQASAEAGESRLALIDHARHGEQTLRALLPFMATLETLCTAATGSIRDYEEDGTPILEQQLIHSRQEQSVACIQDQALEFVRMAVAPGQPASPEQLRDATLAELVRLFYLPSRHELEIFASFSMDENLGSDVSVKISEPEQAIADMRKDGIFFATRMRPRLRRNLAHELRYCGTELSLATLAVYRNELSMRASDWSMREESIPLLYLNGQESTRQQVIAQCTYDGFFRARIPIGNGGTHVGLLLGERHQWLQVFEASILPLELLSSDQPGMDASQRFIFDQVKDHGNGIFECLGENGFVMLPAGSIPLQGNLVLELVYRPILGRPSEGVAA